MSEFATCRGRCPQLPRGSGQRFLPLCPVVFLCVGWRDRHHWPQILASQTPWWVMFPPGDQSPEHEPFAGTHAASILLEPWYKGP